MFQRNNLFLQKSFQPFLIYLYIPFTPTKFYYNNKIIHLDRITGHNERFEGFPYTFRYLLGYLPGRCLVINGCKRIVRVVKGTYQHPIEMLSSCCYDAGMMLIPLRLKRDFRPYSGKIWRYFPQVKTRHYLQFCALNGY